MFSFLSFSPLLLYLCSSQSMGNKISIALMANILHSETQNFMGTFLFSAKTKSSSSFMYQYMKVLNYRTIDSLKSLNFHDTCTNDLTYGTQPGYNKLYTNIHLYLTIFLHVILQFFNIIINADLVTKI